VAKLTTLAVRSVRGVRTGGIGSRHLQDREAFGRYHPLAALWVATDAVTVSP